MALDLSVSLSEHEGEINGSSKIINDPVHGHISIPRYCLEFIGTPFPPLLDRNYDPFPSKCMANALLQPPLTHCSIVLVLSGL